jgi:hypothetical protein
MEPLYTYKSGDSKRWYTSRLIMLGAAALLGALADGISNGYDWRQIAAAAMATMVVYLRADTNKAVTK